MAVITGNSGGNNLAGTAGPDTIRGLGGNDTIDPRRGADRVEAGDGADVVHWYQDAYASGVVDTYIGGQWAESYDPSPYFGRSGGDRLVLGNSSTQAGFRVHYNSTEAGYARDPYGNRVNFSQFERLTTGGGNDVIDASQASQVPARGNPGDGTNYVPAHGVDVTALGGHDSITGSRFDDNLDGGAGNDTIHGGGGWDFIQSSTGNDLIYGEGGNDNIRWGQGNPDERVGNDTIYGGEASEAGGDLLNVWIKDWNDNGVAVRFITNESGTASTHIGGGTSTLNFYQFENFFTHEGRDTVTAANATPGAGNVGIHFNTRWGDDRLTGSAGRDTLEGGEGADTIDGQRGNDMISMTEEAYLPLGNAPAADGQRDVLVMRDGGGFDTIRAFQVGDVRDGGGNIIRRGDVLNLNALHDRQGNVVDVDDVRVSETNGHAVLTFPNGEKLMLENVRAASLTRGTLIRMGLRDPSAQIAAARIDTAAQTAEDTADSGAARGGQARDDHPGGGQESARTDDAGDRPARVDPAALHHRPGDEAEGAGFVRDEVWSVRSALRGGAGVGGGASETRLEAARIATPDDAADRPGRVDPAALHHRPGDEAEGTGFVRDEVWSVRSAPREGAGAEGVGAPGAADSAAEGAQAPRLHAAALRAAPLAAAGVAGGGAAAAAHPAPGAPETVSRAVPVDSRSGPAAVSGQGQGVGPASGQGNGQGNGQGGGQGNGHGQGAPCFCTGTLIRTAEGLVPVEDLRPGDLVWTRDAGAQALRWVGRRALGAAELAAAPGLCPILIRAGALGEGIPRRDLWVSPQHRVLIRSAIARRMFGASEVLVAARQLVALEGIAQMPSQAVEYVHFLFDGHQIVESEGALTESLYPGAEAMRALGPAACDEILTLFPELRAQAMPVARPLVAGARGRQLALRHQRNGKALVEG